MNGPSVARRGIALVAMLLVGACAASPSPTASAGRSTVAAPSAGSGIADLSPSALSSASATSSAPTTPSPVPSATGGAAPTPTPAATPAGPFGLTSSDLRQGGSIPRMFTCDGGDVSPALSWTDVPDETKGLTLIVDDLDAHDFAHWLAYAIPSNMTHLAEGAGSPTTQFMPQGTNDFGRVGYGGPCPPSGTHRYRFTLYALASPLGLSGAPRASAVRAALDKATVLGKVTLTTTYAR